MKMIAAGFQLFVIISCLLMMSIGACHMNKRMYDDCTEKQSVEFCQELLK